MVLHFRLPLSFSPHPAWPGHGLQTCTALMLHNSAPVLHRKLEIDKKNKDNNHNYTKNVLKEEKQKPKTREFSRII